MTTPVTLRSGFGAILSFQMPQKGMRASLDFDGQILPTKECCGGMFVLRGPGGLSNYFEERD